MDEVLAAFLGECHENLEKLDNELVLLEKDPRSSLVQQSLAKIFRTVHTIKGSCGWLGLAKLESVVHDGEDLLVALREEKIPLTTEIVSTLLEMFDAIREILNVIGETEQEGDKDYSLLIQKLKRLQTPAMPPGDEPVPVPEPKKMAAKAKKKSATKEAIVQITTESSAETEEIDAIEPPQQTDSETEALTLKLLTEVLESPTPKIETLKASKDTLEQVSEPVKKTSTPPKAEPKEMPLAEAKTQNLAMESIRVDVRLLDKLMNLVGELVLARNQMLQFSSHKEDNAFNATSQRLNLITTELQEGVMKTRMQMIGTIWNKYPRLVRDLALDCGKQVMLEMEGKETELDRTLIEAIKDPLTHIVRNAIDHGLETPEQRLAAGKPATGKLLLKAYHEGGQVIISISDDGRGLDPEKIRERALEKGLITASEAAQISERALLNLIFLPGFSTAEKVTHVSGRGVGMDVVKNNIEEVGGMVDLFSEVGKGSTFKIKIPLTLAIIPALMVSCQGERFAIPQMNLIELVSLEGEEATKGVEMIYNSPVYRLRGQLLPLVYLNQELGLGGSFNELLERLAHADENFHLNIVVLQADEQHFGLIVDEINDTEEIVVKALGKQLKSISVYAGATILGDGKVALIIDVMGFAQRVKVISEAQQRRMKEALDEQNKGTGKRQSLLLFQAVDRRKMVLPLSHVARLEEFDRKKVEYSGDLKVIQYRKQILPLIYLSEVLPRSQRVDLPETFVDDEPLHVVVCTSNGRQAGLVVEHILDIIETDDDLEIQQSIRREGVLGSIILQDSVTEILDFRSIILKQMPAFFEEHTSSAQLVSLR
ncbi:histidine kinase [bacterium (Candidatus Blackallbacteria) CG17_big_fil_post_rev_8_21_14_2_50_48_46]|uniref:histidine kinase n=1 Tax=bacterium (Candidatus Blackallbacteria) CG17_big_fil_post_rev_8_21_14_2_50_48_46 TaxID=2014261 RepID=A0A2M7FXL6_9BACT|nr:MAG: histidine kinase [bacterium (Candidatus Blackallbacteria) CG18_big_fil_WC_8_21_14_2_50_49_26]PIW13895.1 MAG: histidine kinase [bacterium (Candidatus Blackallbacteria) CG17_big_fil_post_rev_8_21_14_2_50_48_46]PIW45121.1 MAG: histidine kinase [bacterium (Candidatus Blackallbacteria) CG13_big_fil_rev_8_21_14_2_50_49_14]